MTTKTENLEAWEALKLLQEGQDVISKRGCIWSQAFVTGQNGADLHDFIDAAPFRLADSEPDSVKLARSNAECRKKCIEAETEFIKNLKPSTKAYCLVTSTTRFCRRMISNDN